MTGPGLAKRLIQPSPLGISVLLFVAVVATFLPSLRNGFIDYDDAPIVTANPRVQNGFTWSSIGWALGTPVAANWQPLTTLSHMLDCQLYGLKPWGHHLTNVLLHAASTVLLFLVFQRLTGAVWRSTVLAMLFALHPLRVESVAWISERKDVLSTVFWMLTMFAYERYVRESKARSSRPKVAYVWMLLCFACGLMSKPMLVTLPFVLLLLDYWPLQRLWPTDSSARSPGLGRLLAEKAPLFGLAGIASVIAVVVQAGAGNVRTAGQFVLATRAQNALVSYCRYLGKLFWPVDLSPFYPYPAAWGEITVLLSGLVLLGISVLVVVLGRQRRYLPTGWFWFLGTLIPVIGLVQVGKQSMADHYTYIPSIGVLLMLVWGAHELTGHWRYQAVARAVAAAVSAVVCIGFARHQISYWKDDETLWEHALAVTGSNDLANYNLGTAYYNHGLALATQGLLDEAIQYYGKAIRLNPEKEDAHSSLAYALLRQHRWPEAIAEYEFSLRLNPHDAEAHNNLGNILISMGRVDEAIQHLTEALRLQPDYPEAHDNLGAALADRGRFAEAAAQFREVLRLKPDYPSARQKLERALAAQKRLERDAAPFQQALRSNPDDARAHADLGRVLLEAGRLDEAVQQYSEAARLAPKNAEIQYQLGAVLARRGEAQKAARQFELALEIEPKLAPAHYALGILYQHEGRIPEALEHWREAARLAPQWPDPLNNLAWVLATDPHPELRDGHEAVKLANQALKLVGTNNVRVLDTLAAAYAESGQFAEAASTARQAQAAATAQGQADLAAQVQQRLALYASRQPYRQGPEAR